MIKITIGESVGVSVDDIIKKVGEVAQKNKLTHKFEKTRLGLCVVFEKEETQNGLWWFAILLCCFLVLMLGNFAVKILYNICVYVFVLCFKKRSSKNDPIYRARLLIVLSTTKT